MPSDPGIEAAADPQPAAAAPSGQQTAPSAEVSAAVARAIDRQPWVVPALAFATVIIFILAMVGAYRVSTELFGNMAGQAGISLALVLGFYFGSSHLNARRQEIAAVKDLKEGTNSNG